MPQVDRAVLLSLLAGMSIGAVFALFVLPRFNQRIEKSPEKKRRKTLRVQVHPSLDQAEAELQVVNHLAEWVRNIDNIPNPFWGSGERDDIEREVVLATAVRRCASDRYRKAERLAFMRAGPRPVLLLRPSRVVAAIVTCGRLASGINNIIKDIVLTLYHGYGVRDIRGIKNGFLGLYSGPWISLDPSVVDRIEREGGTILGTLPEKEFECDRVIASLKRSGVNQLYLVGGLGTHRAAHLITNEIVRLGLGIAVVVIPSTTEYDIGLIDRAGYHTAISESVRALTSIQTEARCVPGTIGVVRALGRNAGYIAANTVCSAGMGDLCLIPEIRVNMHAVLRYLREKLSTQGYATVVIAEGACQELIRDGLLRRGEKVPADKHGKMVLQDAGPWFVAQLAHHFRSISAARRPSKDSGPNTVSLREVSPGTAAAVDGAELVLPTHSPTPFIPPETDHNGNAASGEESAVAELPWATHTSMSNASLSPPYGAHGEGGSGDDAHVPEHAHLEEGVFDDNFSDDSDEVAQLLMGPAKVTDVRIKYIDPAVLIQSAIANPSDTHYCFLVATNAVHGCMYGYTGFCSAMVSNHTAFIPVSAIIDNSPSLLDLNGRTYERLLSTTRQPKNLND